MLPTRAGADHPLPFTPSYYPHEIRIQTVDPSAAAKLFATHSIHAYVGGDLWAKGEVPAGLKHVESLGAYLAVTFNTGSKAWSDRDSRCAGAGKLVGALATEPGPYVFHPYPVTPFHMDYLQQFDLADSARKLYASRPAVGASGLGLRVRPKGNLAEKLVPSAWRGNGQGWDATVEEIDAQNLVSSARISLNGWLGPPWIKEGWFHAYLLLARSVTDESAKRDIDALYQQLVTGAYGGAAEQLTLERRLVSLLLGGCERIIVGYTVMREYFNDSDYTEGIENVAYDSQAGVASPIFIRTVKLKDYLWNGWLRLGVAGKHRAAWNPLGGFSDVQGRLIWSAVSDPAVIPAPYSAGWVANRVTATLTTGDSPSGGVEVPPDALIPEPGTGVLRPVGDGRTARAKIVYRVLASSFHDTTQMTVADVLYPFIFSYRWGVRHPQNRNEYDPSIEASTALVRAWLQGVRVVRVETEVKRFEEANVTYQVPVAEVYLRYALPDAQQTAAVAPFWSTLPWHLIVLMEEAVKRGVAAFSREEAERRGVAWLDLVRDRTQAFRDFTYPLTMGAFDRYPVPRKAYVSTADLRDGRLEIHAEVERVMKFQRSYTITREALRNQSPDGEAEEVPVCRYVVVTPGGDLISAGNAPYDKAGVFTVDLRGKLKPGPYSVMVALYLGGNTVNPDVKVVPYQAEGAS
ncbi:MAG: hypothetical protein HYS69_12545 [candidate division NC10 bacterium]|nr:hypothetical protein [candidate division NC10 bacterium]